MRHLRTAAIVAVTALVAGIVMMVSGAFGADSTLNMNAGDTAHVTCGGPSLGVANQMATALDLNCAANPTTTTTTPPSTGVLLGDTNIETAGDGSSAPASEAFGYTASTSGTATSASVYLTSTGGAHAALYSDNAGRPGSLLDQGQVASNTAGWATIPLSGGAQVAAGTRYWIALGAVTGGSVTYRDVGSSGSNLDFSGTGFTSPYTATAQWNSNPVSAYVSGTTSGGGATTTTAPPQTTTTVQQTTTTQPSTTTTTVPSGGGICTNPIYSSSANQFQWYAPGESTTYVNNNTWNTAEAGPQTTYICSLSSFYTISNQPNLASHPGSVKSYPSVCYCAFNQTMGSFHTLTSTFGEANTHMGEWDAGYDNWTSRSEIMVQNDASNHPTGAQQGGIAVTIDGVNYHITTGTNTGFICFVPDSYDRQSGSINFLDFFSYLVAHNMASWSDTLNLFGYGTEISWTESSPGVAGQQRFDLTGWSVSFS